MTRKEHEMFCALRRKVAGYIAGAIDEECPHKSVEGLWELTVSYPDFFEDENGGAGPAAYCVTLNCSILCPGRTQSWIGASWYEALAKCRKDVNAWMA